MANDVLTRLSTVDLLTFPISKSFFEMREQHAYYASLKTVDARRGQHSQLVDVCLGFLEFTKSKGEQETVDALIRGSTKVMPARGSRLDVIAELERREPEGCRLLMLSPPLTIETLKAHYRSAAVRFHPDRGGETKAMAAINRAYTEAHELLMANEFLASENFETDSLVRGRLLNCVDYRLMVHRLLFAVFLDDWALDYAVFHLRELMSSSDAGSPQAEQFFSLVMLAPEISKLATRLSLTTRTSDTEFAFRMLQKGVHQATSEGLMFEGYLETAESAVLDGRKPKIVLNHLRQLDNAKRLGILDEKKYSQLKSRICNKNSAKETRTAFQDRSIIEYCQNPGFLQALPTDRCAQGKKAAKTLIPEPGYFANRTKELTDDQQAEYLQAYREPIQPTLTRKYLYVRLQSLFESALLYDSELDSGQLASEALFLSSIKGNSQDFYAIGVAESIKFIASLPSVQRAKRLELLRRMYGDHSSEETPLQGGFVVTMSFTKTPLLTEECFNTVRLPLNELEEVAKKS